MAAAIIKVRVLRPAWLQGSARKAGEVVALDAGQAADAIGSGRCECVDDVEAAHLAAAMKAERDRLLHRLARQP